MSLTRRDLMAASLAGAWGFPAIVRAQERFEMKLANFVPAQHFVSQWLTKWGEGLEARSNGRLQFKHFPGAQMGPTPRHFDMAREGAAEIALFQHGATPGRFNLTELVNLPYSVASAEVGMKVLNDAELRSRYLDAEHRGVKVLMLFTHTPGNVYTTRKAIRSLEDFKGLRLRFATPSIRDFIQSLGATPVGVPPTEVAEQLQKGTIDGAFLDYGGAGIAFRLGGTVKHVAETYCFVASFGIAANEAWFNRLPRDLQQMISESVVGKEKEFGEGVDGLDVAGKRAIVDGGAEIIRLTRAEDDRMRRIAVEVTETNLKSLEAKGAPARAIHGMMKALSERHQRGSRNFWS
jgi:TRAP-type C4-dicarboxylate transport system substrate-binding protein